MDISNFTLAAATLPAISIAPLDWRGYLTLVVVILVLIGLIREIASPDITMFVGTCLLVITGVLSPVEFLEGFSQQILFTLAMLFIVVRALEVNGVLAYLAHKVLPQKGSYQRRLAILTVPTTAASAFLNNTPIVLMLTAVVRQWTLVNQLSPSKYLMPIAFATVLGGMCTLIGTSTNLIVNGLLVDVDPAAGFKFFELAWVGVPAAVLGLLYLIFIGGRLLPDRPDPAAAASAEAREFIGEFEVGTDCALVGKTVEQAGRRYFSRDLLIEIGRGNEIINSPSPREVIQVGDRLVFSSEVSRLGNLHAIKGLKSLADPKFVLDPTSPYFAEVVVAVNSWLIGKTLKNVSFRNHYRASVAAIYREGKRITQPVADIVLRAGDTLMLLSNRPWEARSRYGADFYSITPSQQLPIFRSSRAIFIGCVLLAMVVVATAGIPIMYASLGAAGVLLLSRMVSVRQAGQSIDWHLLLLVGSAFAMGSAIAHTGLAAQIAKGILYVVGTDPHLLIGGIFLATTFVTWFVSNAATALLLFPIALEMITLAGYHSLSAVKAVGVAVAIASSNDFVTPIGYQANMIVYGPGGYRFLDYTKMGAALSFLVWALGTAIIPVAWPLPS
jgi:di/tricarboxylate transporter